MRSRILALIFFVIGISTASGQWDPNNPASLTPRYDVSVGYNYVHANAPPGGCLCFGLQGAYASFAVHTNHWLSFEGEATGQHANDISTLGQDLTLVTFAGGPRVQYNGHRLVPFAKILVGGAHGSDSYFPTGTTSSPSANSFALQTGGGFEYILTTHFSARVDAEYLRTGFPNNSNNEQNHFMLGAGIVYRFSRLTRRQLIAVTSPPSPPEPANDMAMSCSSNVSNLEQGDTLEITAITVTQPEHLDVNYTWNTPIGTLVGSGRRVAVDTQGVPAGEYHIIGHAIASGHRQLNADCDISFRIKTPAEAIKEPTPVPETNHALDPVKDREFHQNVPDALFNYDSSAIRPDAQAAITHAADYLSAHPDIDVLIGGFADDRGSAEYNLGLGQARAEAARKALIASGVPPDRLQIISYGKEVQVCTAENEQCRQQNRRAAFSMHP
jgi:outer membrane protein OmpA-like peptidoglycan-associated protein/opacity protein-like surface antigen